MSDTDFTPHQPVDAEEFFTDFVHKNKGELVANRFSHPPKFYNADFYFPENNVITELKCLKTDFPLLPDYQAKVFNLIEKAVKNGAVNQDVIWGKQSYTNEFTAQYYRIFKSPIQRILEKANKQIKNTKKELELESAEGLVILVNDGLYGVAPLATVSIIAKILTHLYTSIDGFVYLTLNKYLEFSDDDYARLLWIPCYSERASSSLPEFVNDLGRKWFKHLDGNLGSFDSHIESGDGAILNKIGGFIK